MLKKGIITGSIILTAIPLFLFLLLPYLADLYLLPKLTTLLPGFTTRVSLCRITPWQIQGAVNISKNNKQIATIPNLQIYFTPAGLLKKEIDSISISDAILHLRPQDDIPPPVSEDKAATSHPASRPPSKNLVLPFIVNSIIINNSHLMLHQQDRLDNIIINQQLQLFYHNDQIQGIQLTKAEGSFTLLDDKAVAGKYSLSKVRSGYHLASTITVAKLSELGHFFPAQLIDSLHGSLVLQGDMKMNNLNWQPAEWDIDLTVSNPRFQQHSLQFSGNSLGLQMSGSKKDEATTITLNLQTSESRLLIGTYPVTQEQLSLQGSIILSPLHPPHPDLQLTLSNILAGTGVGQIFCPEYLASIQSNNSKTDHFAFIKTDINKIEIKEQEIELQNIKFSFPLQWPVNGNIKADSGTLSIQNILYKTTDMAALAATVKQQETGFAFSGTASFPHFPELQPRFAGKINRNGRASLDYTVPPATLAITPSTLSFMPLPFTFSSTFTAKGSFLLNNGRTSGTTEVEISDATLSMEDNSLSLSGINLAISLPSLPSITSNGGQICHIDNLSIGDLLFTNGTIRYQLESPESLLIERSSFDWSGGQIHSNSLRLSKTAPVIDTTIYCDQLNLSQLLEQFNITEAEGEGALNGRIPIHFSGRELAFNHGYLYSTPGEKSVLRVKKYQILKKGLAGITDSGYLNYSMDSLANFSYDWAKILFNGKGNDLTLTMKLKGKPEKPLPYGYKNGIITATKKGSGLQHPILLDVNFHLPLADIFRYGKNMQSLMENL